MNGSKFDEKHMKYNRKSEEVYIPLEEFKFNGQDLNQENIMKRNLWINNIISCVKEIASADYQERAWVKFEIHKPCDFGEIMCSLFDDSAVVEFIKKANELGLSWKQKRKISKLIRALDSYGDNPEVYAPTNPPMLDGKKMLSDPEWQKIQRMAQKVLDAFAKMKYESENQEDWLDSILYWIFKYSDTENQKRSWVDQSETFFSTPRDMYDGLFMYSDLDDFMDGFVEKIGLTKQQVDALRKFYTQIRATPFKTAEYKGILDNAEWQKLQATAKETLEKFAKNS
ncbi:MAG: hypothetical protein K1X28_06655 [Parachlamydiales bacterium]|nr:hypothetical protein [Parachlamydiales bacterium]